MVSRNADDSWAKAERDDLWSADHYPVCPRCGDVCDDDAKWSACCGVWLRLDAPRSSDLRSRAMQVDELAGAESAAPVADSPMPTVNYGPDPKGTWTDGVRQAAQRREDSRAAREEAV